MRFLDGISRGKNTYTAFQRQFRPYPLLVMRDLVCDWPQQLQKVSNPPHER